MQESVRWEPAEVTKYSETTCPRATFSTWDRTRPPMWEAASGTPRPFTLREARSTNRLITNYVRAVNHFSCKPGPCRTYTPITISIDVVFLLRFTDTVRLSICYCLHRWSSRVEITVNGFCNRTTNEDGAASLFGNLRANIMQPQNWDAWSNKVGGWDIKKDEQCLIIAVITFIHLWFT
jgi:hypothetical protein